MPVEAGVDWSGVGPLAGALRSLRLAGPFPTKPTCLSPCGRPLRHQYQEERNIWKPPVQYQNKWREPEGDIYAADQRATSS